MVHCVQIMSISYMYVLLVNMQKILVKSWTGTAKVWAYKNHYTAGYTFVCLSAELDIGLSNVAFSWTPQNYKIKRLLSLYRNIV